MRWLGSLFVLFGCLCVHNLSAADSVDTPATRSLTIATVNASLYRDEAGKLVEELQKGDSAQAHAFASILQSIRPDIVLINEIDYDEAQATVTALRDLYLHVAHGNLKPLAYPHLYTAPVNTGVDSKLDLNGNHKVGEPDDAWGYGKYEGQYGMVIFSTYPIDLKEVRTFQLLRWSEMPGAKRPVDPKTSESFYTNAIWNQLRLSSKSHWDVPIIVGDRTIHVLASHPTPPAFDGPEDRNGCRNHDEVRFWSDYLSRDGSAYIRDDEGHRGGLDASELCVVVGDLNADPVDGTGQREAIERLLGHPRLQDPQPLHRNGTAPPPSRERKPNERLPVQTAQFSFGRLRVDYVLPSVQFRILESGVFWPLKTRQKPNGLTVRITG